MNDQQQYFGQADVTTSGGRDNAMYFAIWQQIERMQTSLPVKVLRVRPGGVGPVGFVDIQVMCQMTGGDGKVYSSPEVPNVPYSRYQGGNKAVIIDPEPGDMGIALFASRDISAIKNSRSIAPPGSKRSYDFSDAMYIGGILNGTPTHYIQFTDGGVLIKTPGQVKAECATAVIQASASAAVEAPSVSIGAGGSTLRSMIDERIIAVYNGHTHPANGAAPSQQITDASSVSTSATKAN